MTQYSFIMATFSTRVPTGTGGSDLRPFSGSVKRADFTTATISHFSVTDDDPNFNAIYSTYEPEDQQTLVQPVTFGQMTTPTAAGTQLSMSVGSILTDAAGNKFYAFFPHIVMLGQENPVLAGDKYSVIIVPVADPKTGIWPTFDPTKILNYSAQIPVNATTPWIKYDPTPPCFTPGTSIATASGEVLVEDLKPGDLIRTLDRGFRPLDWIAHVDLDAARLDLSPNLRPIRLAAGCLGPGIPARDLVVSPQHRILIRSRIAERMFGCAEVLVAAKHLVELEGVSVEVPKEGVTYLHLLFDRHEILRSNGAWTESLFVGKQALASLGPAARREIAALFPGLCGGDAPAPARAFLRGAEGRQLAFRHRKNARCLVEMGA